MGAQPAHRCPALPCPCPALCRRSGCGCTPATPRASTCTRCTRRSRGAALIKMPRPACWLGSRAQSASQPPWLVCLLAIRCPPMQRAAANRHLAAAHPRTHHLQHSLLHSASPCPAAGSRADSDPRSPPAPPASRRGRRRRRCRTAPALAWAKRRQQQQQRRRQRRCPAATSARAACLAGRVAAMMRCRPAI